MTMTSAAPTLVPENALTTDPKCLWKPSHPENTHMEKFRQLMQSKHQDVKLGMNPFEVTKSNQLNVLSLYR